MPKVAVVTITRNRLAYTKKAFRLLNNLAGCAYDHFVYDNGSTDGTKQWLQEQELESKVFADHNMGQHVAMNNMLDTIRRQPYRYVLRMDNDIFVKSKRILSRLMECSNLLKDAVILSPLIDGLRWQPPRSEIKKIGKFTAAFTTIIGGQFRLMPLALIEKLTFDVRQPLGFGEANQLSNWCIEKTIPMAFIENLHASHGVSTDDQTKKNPSYFKEHDCLQHYPYAPPIYS